MTQHHDPTIETYNLNAREISQRFRQLGSRKQDIERALKLAGVKNDASVVELGSGDGRDAIEIYRRVDSYVGVEPSEGLLEIARNDFPGINFVKSTAQDYSFPEDVDIVFAFASILHLNKDELQNVLSKVKDALKPGGVFYISTKEGEGYNSELRKDAWGLRQFYLYSEQNLIDLASDGFDKIYVSRQIKSGVQGDDTKWLTIAFKKQ